MKTKAGSRARSILVRVCVFAVLLALNVPLSAHPAGDFLPPRSGPVTLLAPGKLKNAPFLPDTKENPLFLAYEEMLGKLEAKHIQVEVRSLAVFEDGFLLNSTATPATVRYILKYKLLDDKIAWTESGEGDAVAFNLTVPDSGSFRITFPAKDWLLFTANKPPAPADDPSEAKKPESEKKNEPAVSLPELMKALPEYKYVIIYSEAVYQPLFGPDDADTVFVPAGILPGIDLPPVTVHIAVLKGKIGLQKL